MRRAEWRRRWSCSPVAVANGFEPRIQSGFYPSNLGSDGGGWWPCAIGATPRSASRTDIVGRQIVVQALEQVLHVRQLCIGELAITAEKPAILRTFGVHTTDDSAKVQTPSPRSAQHLLRVIVGQRAPPDSPSSQRPNRNGVVQSHPISGISVN